MPKLPSLHWNLFVNTALQTFKPSLRELSEYRRFDFRLRICRLIMPTHSANSSTTFSLPDDLYRFSFDSDESTAAGSDFSDMLHEKPPLKVSTAGSSSVSQIRQHMLAIRHIPAFNRLSMVTRRGVRWLVPSFLANPQPTQHTLETQSKPNTKIAALDGLRGLACLCVFNEHFTYNIDRSFMYGYGVEGHNTTIQRIPFRLLWSGFSMVSLFFVISGYVLSYKPLKQMRSKKMSELQTTLTSSVFRRAFRLFLPGMIATVIAGLFVYLGAFEAGRRIWNTDENYLGLHEPSPPLHPGLINQISDAIKCSTWILDIWKWHDDSVSTGDYDYHTWTLPVEFRCSMALFLMQIATAKLRQNMRLLVVSSFIVFCILSDRKHVQLFLAGMLIAELDMIRQNFNVSALPISQLKLTEPNPRLRSAFWPVLFAIGCYLCSVPVSGADSTPGFITLCNWTPSLISDKAWFIRGIGAVAVVWSAVNSAVLQPFFTNSVSAYLGQISFALYLVHGNVLKSVQYAALPRIYSIVGLEDFDTATSTSMVRAWMLCLALVLPITIWLSDLFWRAVDLPCVRLARWIERVLSDDDETLAEAEAWALKKSAA